MSSYVNARSWLFDPAHLKLVHQCRRLILSEFGVKLHLNEEHLEASLAEYARKTRSRHLAHTWEALKARVPELHAWNEAEEAKKTYRGLPIAEDGQPDEEGETHHPAPRQKKVIYRGQVVG
ncbi:MAG: hypothetical protein VX939_01220 [Pseudomonadota bacterium]|nr:hypothetical protein [Pseudomonadota bacterium]